MSRIIPHAPSPAMVVACLALFLAGSGTGIAVVNALPANSVGTAQLKANAVVSGKVKDGSLLGKDFAADQLPSGIKGLQIVSAESAANSNSTKTLIVSCPAGKKVLSGGGLIFGTTTNVSIIASVPLTTTAWEVWAIEVGTGTPDNWMLSAAAVCAPAE